MANAPRVFVSYSHDNTEHRDNIADFAQELRRNGLDTHIDQFVENTPPLSWPRWMADEVEAADFVLLVFTETYARRFEGREEVGVGFGARWEGSIITSDLYFSEDDRVKFIPVIVAAEDRRFISRPLGLTNFYEIGAPGNRSLTKLLRHLHGQPELTPADLGQAPVFSDSSVAFHGLSDEHVALLVRAQEFAAEGKIPEAEQIALPLVDSGIALVAASAAYVIGQIRLQDEQYAASISAFNRALELSDNASLSEQVVEDLRAALTFMNSHYGEGGPVEAGREYLHLVQQGAMEEVWVKTEPTLRLVLAQAWIWANREHPRLAGFDREELAIALSSLTSSHEVKPDFYSTQLREMQDSFQNYDDQRWGAAERPRRFGMEYELIIFMETGGEVLVYEGGMSPPALPLLMRRIGGTWTVANFYPKYPVPGWPPTSTDLPNLDIDIH